MAIAQVCSGHRKADLWNPAAYPMPCPVGKGRTVCLPYLAALLRLADELDIAFDRNFSFLYDPEHIDVYKRQSTRRSKNSASATASTPKSNIISLSLIHI